MKSFFTLALILLFGCEISDTTDPQQDQSGDTLAPPAVVLSALSLSQGVLSPAFSAVEITYTASVANAVSSTDVTVTAAADLTVSVNGTAVLPGEPSPVPFPSPSAPTRLPSLSATAAIPRPTL